MILITGATGFLGRTLVDNCLTAGYEVRALVRNPEGRDLPWKGLVDIAEGDVLDILSLCRAMEGVDTVLHAAAMVSFLKKDHDQLMRVNVEGTANVVDACLETGLPQLIHISSIASIGRAAKGQQSHEETPLHATHIGSNYAKSKIGAEREVQRGVAEGLQASILNPGMILGAGNWDDGTPKIFRTVANGLAFYNGGSNGWVAAEDVAQACLLAIDQDPTPGERYILVGENRSYHWFLTEVATQLKQKAPGIKIPRFVAIIAGWISEKVAPLFGKEPLLTLENMRSGTRNHAYDGSKITQLGLQYTPIEQVIAHTAQAYLAQHPA
ncbi:MAG: NAD-dependent epimerase/dehydratase family protein [Bacteroidota bacterium]